ncbi:hypothetical protein [Novosphingobium olei]|uniref:Uncharacterized protein n=1 Tax=Novosphingobium olei TaxID=2728851 RepID=A0A7Y0G9H6_9SPHN|nr:hypothetical protein [Novosphingobium olei]NML93053.1 hypothetical protein [Novosphingobium olei]
MSTPDARWVPAFAAFEALRKQYEAANYYADDEVCWKAASDALLRRLQSGQLPSRASLLTEDWDNSFEIEPEPPLRRDADGMFPVPLTFWAGFAAAFPIRKEWDWLAGDFEFKVDGKRTGWGENGSGSALGLEVDANQLPHFSWPRPSDERAGESVPSPVQRGGGRPAANWWPDFAEELAIYIHETGIPEGQGHDGQSTIIDAVFARMSERKKTEPGRGTVQPVVNAILRRLRSAGN